MKRIVGIGIVVLVSCFTMALRATASGLPFHNDDFSGAVSEARQRQLPIFVEVWAPW
jgi:hypothetical protein